MRTAVSALLLILCLQICACQTPQQRASRVVADELASRERSRAESNKLYQDGVKANEEGDLVRAAELLSKATRVDDQNAFAWMMLGVVEEKRERYYDAAEAFSKAAHAAPTRYEPHFNTGSVLESVGRFKAAAQAYETALELAPGQLEVMENLARCYIRSHESLDKARELVARSLELEQRPDWRQWLQLQSLRLARQEKSPDQASGTP